VVATLTAPVHTTASHPDDAVGVLVALLVGAVVTLGVFVGTLVAVQVAVRVNVFVGTGVQVEVAVLLGKAVLVRVLVGGTGVLVGGTGVLVGGTGEFVAVGGTCVGVDVAVRVLVRVAVRVGVRVAVPVFVRVAVGGGLVGVAGGGVTVGLPLPAPKSVASACILLRTEIPYGLLGVKLVLVPVRRQGQPSLSNIHDVQLIWRVPLFISIISLSVSDWSICPPVPNSVTSTG
jgi:hypothetical protein